MSSALEDLGLAMQVDRERVRPRPQEELNEVLAPVVAHLSRRKRRAILRAATDARDAAFAGEAEAVVAVADPPKSAIFPPPAERTRRDHWSICALMRASRKEKSLQKQLASVSSSSVVETTHKRRVPVSKQLEVVFGATASLSVVSSFFKIGRTTVRYIRYGMAQLLLVFQIAAINMFVGQSASSDCIVDYINFDETTQRVSSVGRRTARCPAQHVFVQRCRFTRLSESGELTSLPLICPPLMVGGGSAEYAWAALQCPLGQGYHRPFSYDFAGRCQYLFAVRESDAAPSNVLLLTREASTLPPNGFLLHVFCMIHQLHLATVAALAVLDQMTPGDYDVGCMSKKPRHRMVTGAFSASLLSGGSNAAGSGRERVERTRVI
jgi:hypothetical protein